MLTYHLINTLISSEDHEWKQLVKTQLGDDIHPKRAMGFCLARAALRKCLNEKSIQLPIHEIILEGYGAVKGQSSLTISLSHTPEWGAAVVANANEILSVGIDIEPVQRIVKPMILERISHPQDLALPALSIWSLKEASFKALMNTGKFTQNVEFSDLKISENKWMHVLSQTEGEWKLEEKQGLVVALAWIKI